MEGLIDLWGYMIATFILTAPIWIPISIWFVWRDSRKSRKRHENKELLSNRQREWKERLEEGNRKNQDLIRRNNRKRPKPIKTPKQEAVRPTIKTFAEQKGKWGEEEIAKRLVRITGEKRIMKNLIIPKEDGGTTEIDILMIHELGIFVIESKNYIGWIFGSENSKQWTQTLWTGDKHSLANPIKQNQLHVNSLIYNLKKEMRYLSSYVQHVHSLIIFGEDATLKEVQYNAEKAEVITIHGVDIYFNKIKNKKGHHQVFTHEQINLIYAFLKQYEDANGELRKKHLSQFGVTVDIHSANNQESLMMQENEELIKLKDELDEVKAYIEQQDKKISINQNYSRPFIEPIPFGSKRPKRRSGIGKIVFWTMAGLIVLNLMFNGNDPGKKEVQQVNTTQNIEKKTENQKTISDVQAIKEKELVGFEREMDDKNKEIANYLNKKADKRLSKSELNRFLDEFIDNKQIFNNYQRQIQLVQSQDGTRYETMRLKKPIDYRPEQQDLPEVFFTYTEVDGVNYKYLKFTYELPQEVRETMLLKNSVSIPYYDKK